MGNNINSIIPETLNKLKTKVVLKVNGESYNAWKSININQSLTQISGSFSFTAPSAYITNRSIATGDECIVEIDGDRIITGYIDDVEDRYDINTHDITFTGRDKTGDLVDCCYDIFEGDSEFKDISAYQIIKKLCEPFNINVIGDASVIAELNNPPIPSYSIEVGENVYSNIISLCQQYAVLPISNGYGDLYLTRAGSFKVFDTLESGINIKSNKVLYTDKDRFSVYYAISNKQSSVFDKSLNIKAKLNDNNIKRTRPIILLVGEQGLSEDICQKRVAWEARIRAGGGRKIETTVQGWLQKGISTIWLLNGIVEMKDYELNIKDKLLIAGINFSLNSSSGELTTLQLVHPYTFELKKNQDISENEGLNAFGRKLA